VGLFDGKDKNGDSKKAVAAAKEIEKRVKEEGGIKTALNDGTPITIHTAYADGDSIKVRGYNDLTGRPFYNEDTATPLTTDDVAEELVEKKKDRFKLW
jgi:hypothetical protein